MMGEYPTVGCLVLLEKASFQGLETVVQALRPTTAISLEPDQAGAVQYGQAMLGDSQLEMLALVHEAGDVTAVHIEFDEDEVTRIAQQTGLSLEQLFMPYVQAAKAVPGVLAIGIGFELSPPSNFYNESIQQAGIVILFALNKAHKSWSRQQTMPLVGHYA